MCVFCVKGYLEVLFSEDFGFRLLVRVGLYVMFYNKGIWESEYLSWYSVVRRGLQRGGRVGGRQCWYLDYLQGYFIIEYRQLYQVGIYVFIQDYIGIKLVIVFYSKDKRMGRFYTLMLV